MNTALANEVRATLKAYENRARGPYRAEERLAAYEALGTLARGLGWSEGGWSKETGRVAFLRSYFAARGVTL